MKSTVLFFGEVSTVSDLRPIIKFNKGRNCSIVLTLVNNNSGEVVLEFGDSDYDVFALYRVAKYLEMSCWNKVNSFLVDELYKLFSRLNYSPNFNLVIRTDYVRVMDLKIPKTIQNNLLKLYFFGLLKTNVLLEEFFYLDQSLFSKILFKLTINDVVLRKKVIKFILKKSKVVTSPDSFYLIDLVKLYYDSNGRIKKADWNGLVEKIYKKNPIKWKFSLENSEKFASNYLQRLVYVD